MARRADFQTAVDQFSDWRWRLNNLYWITDKSGKRVRFEMNWTQMTFFEQMHYLNVLLKARQLGLTTFIQIFMLDACVFNRDIRAGTIAHTLGDVQTIFRDKIKYPYDNLPEGIRNAVPVVRANQTELLLGNNSSIRVGTSLRSGTLQYLHISEYGKLCAKYPDKAREVRTGALNTVQAGQLVFVESTAEGQEGHFYTLCEDGQVKQRQALELTELDFKFHFFPWWKEPQYAIAPERVIITDAFAKYFGNLADQGITLTDRQKAWYVKKAETQLGDMKREYPSTPAEAFEASVEGAYYADQMAVADAEERIGVFPHVDGYKQRDGSIIQVTNPYGLAAIASTGQSESQFSTKRANSSWSDPSGSGKPGTSGGIMSWRNTRLQKLYNFAAQKGEEVGAISPQTQAEFFLQEDPRLVARLAVALVASFEGLRQNAYPDPATQGKPWTICYGSTNGVKPGDRKTVEQCKALLALELQTYASGI
ncbi:MAG: hypothetical protein WCE42_34165, partial [Rhizobium ruizarguesonis]